MVFTTMANLGKIGGYMEFVSVFLPVLFITNSTANISIIIIYWLFGLMIFNTMSITGVILTIDISGIVFTILIIMCSIIIISNEGKQVRAYGVSSIVVIVFYLISQYAGLAIFINTSGMGGVNIVIIPFIGFFGIIIGSILVIIEGGKS
ncbi:MAG: hypothetical protein ACFE8A_09945 [Candidatus Hodarchaeota archaeon]